MIDSVGALDVGAKSLEALGDARRGDLKTPELVQLLRQKRQRRLGPVAERTRVTRDARGSLRKRVKLVHTTHWWDSLCGENVDALSL